MIKPGRPDMGGNSRCRQHMLKHADLVRPPSLRSWACLVWTAILASVTVPAVASGAVHGTFGGGAAGGSGSVIGETVVQIVRSTYPGSGLGYTPGSIAGSLIAMLTGKMEYCLAASGDVREALNGEPPFRRSYPAQNLYIVANLIDPNAMIGAVYARARFVEQHALKALSDLRDRAIPVRLSTNTLGNAPMVRQNRAVFEAIGLTESLLEQRGGADYHLPDTAALGLMQDGKMDLVITVTFHPDYRAIRTSRAVPMRLLPFGEGIPAKVAARLGTTVATIPAGTYDFLEEDYEGPSLGGLYIAAGPSANDEDTYRIARALHLGMDRIRHAHPAFSSMRPELLVQIDRGLRLHPAAARYYKEIGLLH